MSDSNLSTEDEKPIGDVYASVLELLRRAERNGDSRWEMRLKEVVAELEQAYRCSRYFDQIKREIEADE